MEEQTKRIVAVGLDYAGSTLQVQPFAAPRTTGLWEETREQIRAQIRQQGGRVEEREGPLGPELLAEVPVAAGPDGAAGKRLARFVGVDGPRWFLRGVIGGAATGRRRCRRPGRGALPLDRRRPRRHSDAAARSHPAADAGDPGRRVTDTPPTAPEPDREARPRRR